MASKEALTISNARWQELNFTIHTEASPNDREVWVEWTKIKDVFTKNGYDHTGKIGIKWNELIMDSNGVTSWHAWQASTSYSKDARKSSRATANSQALAVRAYFRREVANSFKDKYKTPSYSADRSVTYYFSEAPIPTAPGEPTVEINDNNQVVVSQSISDTSITKVQFTVYEQAADGTLSSSKTDIKTVPATRYVEVIWGQAKNGCKYYAKSEWWNSQGGSSESSGSSQTETAAIPSQVTGVTVKADSISTVEVNWNEDPAAAPTEGYQIEVAKEAKYMGTNQRYKLETSDGPPDIISVESGSTLYFRVRSKNSNGKYGPWSHDKDYPSIIMGTKPSPPSTWTLYSSYKLTDPINLYWTFNSGDGSKPTKSIVYWRIGQGTLHSHTIYHTYPETQTEFTFSWDITTDPSFNVSDGDKISWYVVSYGISEEGSDPSIEREFAVYIPPEVHVYFDDFITQYPFDIEIDARPSSQHLVSGVITIQNVDTYESTNRYGEDVIINAGTTLYSQVFDGFYGNNFVLSLDPSNIELISDQTYLISVKIVMDSGLMADNSGTDGRFSTSFERVDFVFDSGLVFNKETYAASLTPGCWYYDEDEDYTTDILVPNFSISVYRLNSDGSLVEITKDLPNNGDVTVIDPHPSLDIPTYRIVGTDMTTGFMYFLDTSTEDTNIPGIIMQWDESYKNYIFGDSEDPENFGYAYNGVTLELPYNVKISDASSKDVELVEYYGRENPVSYYGTQQGKTANWSCEFDKKDKDILTKLRRLDRWKDNVYVREQSGLGYWATVEVSYNMDYDSLIIPASFQITKVDSNRP